MLEWKDQKTKEQPSLKISRSDKSKDIGERKKIQKIPR